MLLYLQRTSAHRNRPHEFRIKVLKEAEKSEINFASKTADYIQQQTNAKAGDWIVNGVFNKK